MSGVKSVQESLSAPWTVTTTDGSPTPKTKIFSTREEAKAFAAAERQRLANEV